MKRSHGKMVGRTRSQGRHKKELTLNDMIKNFDAGEKVVVEIQSNYHRGMPHPRFHGKHGVVVCRQGDAYKIEVMDGNKKKILLIAPTHIKKSG